MTTRDRADMATRNIAGAATALWLCVGQAPTASALSLDDVAFHHSFEQGATADLARGKAEPLQTLGAPEFVNAPGRDGKVMKLRSGRDALVFELDRNFNPEQGAISFHLSAVNWDGSNGDALQVLFHTDGTDQEQQLVVQTLWPWGSLFMPLYDRGALLGGFPAGRTCSAPLRQGKDLENVLKTGYFYHYVITWRDGYQALYLNGKLMAEARQPALRLRTLGRTFTLGWNRQAAKIFWDPGCEEKAKPLAAKEWQSLVDDVTVFRSFVFPNEVARMHQYGALDYARRAEPRTLAIEAEFYQTRSVLSVQVVAPSDEPKKLALEVLDAEGACVHRQEIQLAPGENLKKVDLDLHAMPVGAYRVRASLTSGFATEWIDFEKVNPEWLGNDLGKADIVLSPWTPVEVKPSETAVEIGVWGRNYRYEGPLPAQIVSQGENLLSGPVHCVVNGKSVAWTPPKIESATPTRVALSSTATAGAYALKGETRVEYDGFTWSTFTFRAEKTQNVDSLYVDIPLQRSESVFLQYPTRRDCFFPKEDGWSSEWEPYVFVGSDERGLQWYAESDQWWHGENGAHAIQVRQTKEGPVLRLNVIRDVVNMPAEFSLSFGLMGSPVRPRPANWRGWGTATRQRMGDHRHFRPMGLDYSWWSVSPGWLIPNNCDPESQGRDPNILWLPFTSTTFRGMRPYAEGEDLVAFMPLWKQFAAEWRGIPEQASLGTLKSWNQTFINPASSFIDRFAWEVNELFSKWKHVQGLYFDGYAGANRTANLDAGFGYVGRDGATHPVYPILAGRELMRRVYALRLKHKPDGAMMIHPATTLMLPILSHASVIYDGEFMGWGDISQMIDKNGLYAGLTPDKTRFLMNYKAMGLVPYIDTRWVTRRGPGVEKSQSDHQSWNRLAYGLFMVDDVHSAPLASYSTVIMNAVDAWGLSDPRVEFFPHYAETPVATTGWRDRTSCWVIREEGKALIATLNISGYGRSPRRLAQEGRYGYEIKLDLKRLGLTPGKIRAYDAESFGTLAIPVDGDTLSLKMDVNELMLIALEKTE